MQDLEKTEVTTSSNTFLRLLCSARVKTLLTLLILFILMFGGFLAIVLGIFPQSYSKLEDSTTRDAGKRITRAMFDDITGTFRSVIINSIWVCCTVVKICYT